MAVSTGKTGRGVSFQISDEASPTPNWTSVANARSINRSGAQADEIDFTHLASTGAYREFRQGFKDGGSINIEYHFDATAATHVGTNGFLGLFTSGEVFTWRINFSPAWTKALVGTGYVSNPGDIDVNVDGPIQGTAVVRITGDVSLVNVS